VHFSGSCDEETAMLAGAQAYLACRTNGCLPSLMLEQAWHAFHVQCEHLARRILAVAYGKWCAADGDDFVQEALRQVIAKLPGLVIRRNHRRAYSWVVRVVWREIGRAVSRHERYSLRHQPLYEDMAESLPCPHPGPEELCIVSETRSQVGSALRQLKAQTSPTTYEIFCRRFLEKQTASQIAAALGLTAQRVHLRYDRVKRKWRRLTRDQVFSE
jgi:RNA polymerase sigma factor (sigma-70 family)